MRRGLILTFLGLAMSAPATAFEAVAALSYYMDQSHGRLIVADLPALTDTDALRADVLVGDRALATGVDVVTGRHSWVEFPIFSLPAGDSELTCRLHASGRTVATATTTLTRLPPKDNAVQIDRLSGGVIVDGLPLFPFGFYCYSPVQETLAEEEVVRGFNLMSPYQSNEPTTRSERLAYMDRAAELGMKVHYQLLSVAGGGGVYSGTTQDTSAVRRRQWLRAEVEAVRDHPALLAWYISDEPTGHGASPEDLQASYEAVRRLDPYHPVTIVFLNPGAAQRYAGAMDLAMVDPYPIPNGPPAGVGQAVGTAVASLAPRIPVWLVPQAFGGNEFWTREPTAPELRLMTWLGIVEGATGVQYFIRHGLSGFPKSPAAWSAASRVALEVAALTPHLLSRQEAPVVVAAQEAIRAAAWRRGDEILIAAINTENQPRELELQLPDLLTEATVAEVLYEDRSVPLLQPSRAGPFGLLLKPVGVVTDLLRAERETSARQLRLQDVVDAYGVRLYRLAGPQPPGTEPLNVLVDPSFEWDAAPSVPAAIYADVGDGRGGTYFTDPRRAYHGRRSLRLVTPRDGQGVRIRPFAPTVSGGRSHRFSVWARTRHGETATLRLHLYAAGDAADFELTEYWQHYGLDGVVGGGGGTRAALGVELATAGTAWIDAMEFYDISPRILTQASPTGHEITVESVVPEGQLHLRLDGEPAAVADRPYTEPVTVAGSSAVRVALVRDGRVLARAALDLHHHGALGRFVDLQHPYSPRYPAGGPGALTDGILGSSHFNDGRWQGFEGEDMVAVIDLGQPRVIESVACRFLQSVPSWIWMPRVMEVNLSDDGRRFRPFTTADHDVDERAREARVRELVAATAPDIARYVRVRARSMGSCPQWHPGAGGPAWVFADEIRINAE